VREVVVGHICSLRDAINTSPHLTTNLVLQIIVTIRTIQDWAARPFISDNTGKDDEP